MSDLNTRFEAAAEDLKRLKARPTDLELLEIYGLFKQATEGDCNRPKPGMFQLKEKAKHEHWSKLAGLSQDEAKEKYCEKIAELVTKYQLNDS